ncbi:MAG TPA: ChbG/HpnK family deacetylase [Xanthobacteraceae bacterium]|nr:ChbG/HpnK family deacetylase [Xanthobacteraceae bacterium]
MNETKLRRIWLCADDYGISPAVGAAIRELIARGRINATSAMVVAPGFSPDEAGALADAAKTRAAIGLHLTLTAPFRPLTDFVPLRGGAFLPLAPMAGRALLRSLDAAALDMEIARQFAAFDAAFGRAPDYVDGHQHIHVFPQVSEALLRVIREAAPKAWLRQCGRSALARKSLGDPKGYILDALSARLRRLAAAAGVRTNAAFAGTYSFAPQADYAALFPDFLDGLPDGGLVMCHPGHVDPQLRQLDPLTDLRESEYAFLGGEDFPQLLAARGIALAAP